MTVAEPASVAVEARPTLVEVRRLHVSLGDAPVLRSVSLTVQHGQSVALVGPNGAGKSTLLRTLAGLIRPESGSIMIAGQALTKGNSELRRAIGLVGYQPMLYPEMTARENLRFYGRLYGLPDLNERIETGLRRFDLLRQADATVSTLSRGMVQRLTLTRAMLHDPTLLLLDEPDAGLDARAAEALAATVRDHRAAGAAIFASHDVHRVHELADAVVFLVGGRVAETLDTAGQSVADLQSRYTDLLARHPTRAGAP